MDLLEYQAKQLFSQVEIPVLPSQSISEPAQLKNLLIPYPIVLKSQVRAGGRGKAGGVRFVENTIDAIAAAQAIFNLPIENEYPDIVLAEAKYNAEDEFFLAVMFDYQLKRPILLGSHRGGIDIESLLENMQTCVIEEEFSPFYARRLATKMGLEGNLIDSVSKIIEKMYDLFWEKDLEIIEINPLGISFDGDVMALDGKIRVNDYALTRHPDLLELIHRHHHWETHNSAPQELSPESTEYSSFVQSSLFSLDSQGNIALLTNSVDLAIVTGNLILERKSKNKLGACFIVDFETEDLFKKQLKDILNQIYNLSNIDTIFVNILGSNTLNNYLLDVIANYYQTELNLLFKGDDRIERRTGTRTRSRRSSKVEETQEVQTITGRKPIKWILRLVGEEMNTITQNLADLPLQWTDNLEKAIELIIKF
jgi:succinyl-CoA synthetase beta subunit